MPFERLVFSGETLPLLTIIRNIMRTGKQVTVDTEGADEYDKSVINKWPFQEECFFCD